jgi:hypothetical protein
MPAPRIPRHRDWTGPLRRTGYEPTELHVHVLDAPPTHLAALDEPAQAGTDQPAANASRWTDSSTHPAEWVLLAIAGAIGGVVMVAGALGVTP